MITIDTRDFESALRNVVRVVEKDVVPDIINKNALKVVIGAKGVRGVMKRTPRASREAIKSVPISDIARIVMARARKRGEKLTARERDKRIRAEYNRRIRSIGYTAGPGWDKAARALGGRGVRRQKGFEMSEAAKGRGKKARASYDFAEIVNTAPAAEEIGIEPLQEAIRDVARDMQAYADRKLVETLRRASA